MKKEQKTDITAEDMMINQKEVLKLFIEESLRRPSRHSKTMHIYHEISYVRGILGIKNTNIFESARSLEAYNNTVLKEHLLFEGWWDSAKSLIGSGIDAVKEKIEDGADALKVYGENAKGVIAALWSAVQDEESLNTLISGSSSLVSKSVSAINKAIFKIENRLKELDLQSLSKILEKTRNVLTNASEKIQAITGWKGMLAILASYMCFSWLRTSFGPVMQSFFNAISGDIKDFSKTMLDLAGSVSQDYKDMFDVGTGDPKELIKKFVEQKISKMIPDLIKEKISAITGDAIASLAGPVGWLKKAYDLFETSSWVLSKIMEAIRRGNFKVSKE